MIILVIFTYLFMATLTFKILEVAKIGFAGYWFDDNDHSLIWASTAIMISIFWIVILPVLGMSKLLDFFIKKISK